MQTKSVEYAWKLVDLEKADSLLYVMQLLQLILHIVEALLII